MCGSVGLERVPSISIPGLGIRCGTLHVDHESRRGTPPRAGSRSDTHAPAPAAPAPQAAPAPFVAFDETSGILFSSEHALSEDNPSDWCRDVVPSLCACHALPSSSTPSLAAGWGTCADAPTTITTTTALFTCEREKGESFHGTQYSKKERAERFKEPRSDRTVVEAASYEATKGTDEQAALLQDRKWSTLNGAASFKEQVRAVFDANKTLSKAPPATVRELFAVGKSKGHLDGDLL